MEECAAPEIGIQPSWQQILQWILQSKIKLIASTARVMKCYEDYGEGKNKKMYKVALYIKKHFPINVKSAQVL